MTIIEPAVDIQPFEDEISHLKVEGIVKNKVSNTMRIICGSIDFPLNIKKQRIAISRLGYNFAKEDTLKKIIIGFIMLIASASFLVHPNDILAQVTMCQCTPDMGINVSMVNCLTNSTSDTYNHSMVAEMRQNQTGEVAQEAMNGSSQTATQGMEAAMNETGEALSNATGGVMEGIKDLVNGSS